MAGTAEKYLKPEVIRQVARLTCAPSSSSRASSRACTPARSRGSRSSSPSIASTPPATTSRDIDWNVYAKTDRFYIKKFQAETNLTGYHGDGSIRLDGLHLSPGVDEVRIRHQPGGGALLPDDPPAGSGRLDRLRPKVSQSLAPGSKRSQLGNILSLLAKLKPAGTTDIETSLHQVAGMLRHRSLVMLFSDLLGDPEPILKAIHRLRFAGHDLIIFHILDEAEALFPVRGDAAAGRQRDARDDRGRRRCDQGRLSGRGREVSGRFTRPNASALGSITCRCTPGCRSTRPS